MKNQVTITLIALFIAFSSVAQDFEIPKKGAKIYVENTTVEVNEGGESSFDLFLIKSKVARKATFENPKLMGPKGVSFLVTQDTVDPTRYTVSINAEQITPGDYSITVTSKRSGIHAVTGTFLTLKVNPGNSVASKDGE